MALRPSESDPLPDPRGGAGLCDSCIHQRLVRNGRGSVFSLCERSRIEDAYPRYPRVPVRDCRGHEQRGEPERTDRRSSA